jgi:3-isopropylmalate/(R)-2-methylmalate dehydratase small subunit
MAKEKFDIIQSTCIPIQIDNCNTDLIIPARYLASTTRDPQFFGDAFMHDLRFDAEGNPVADFVMNQSDYSEAPHKGVHEIIVGGQNWGSGSSREHAAWAIAGYGVRVVISSSFADIHRNNLLNCFVLPVIVSKEFQQELFDSIAANPQTEVKVDVPNQTVTNLATGNSEHFDINSYKKYCLMNAYDDIDFLLSNTEKIEAYEQQGETTEAKEEATACTEATKSVPENTLPAPATKADLAAAEKIADEEKTIKPFRKLPIDRSLTKMILFGFITLGIYNIIVMTKISREINIVASKYDGRTTTNALWIILLWSWLTGGIASIVWTHCICNRIGNELQRRQVPKTFGASDFWGWCILGALIYVGPFIFVHKFMHAMNHLNADYNQKG